MKMAQIQFTPYVTQNTFKLPQIEESDIPIIRGKKKEVVLAPLPTTETPETVQEVIQEAPAIID